MGQKDECGNLTKEETVSLLTDDPKELGFLKSSGYLIFSQGMIFFSLTGFQSKEVISRDRKILK